MWTMIWYSFLTKIKNVNVLFWPLVFPFVLTTAMYLSIGQIEEADFETVRAAVVSPAEETEEPFRLFLDSMEQDSDLLATEEMSEQDAEDALEEGSISGIFYAGAEPSLTVGGSGFPQTILQMVLESYTEGKETLEDVAQFHPEGMDAALVVYGKLVGILWNRSALGGRTTDSTAQFFYAMMGNGVPVRMLHRLSVCYGSAGKSVGSGGAAVCESCAQDAVDPFRDSSIFRPSFF